MSSNRHGGGPSKKRGVKRVAAQVNTAAKNRGGTRIQGNRKSRRA
jgi:hypothetical protein